MGDPSGRRWRHARGERTTAAPLRRLGPVAGVLALLLLGAACGVGSPSQGVAGQAGQQGNPQLIGDREGIDEILGGGQSGESLPGGVSLVPLSIPQYIFGGPIAFPKIQPGSSHLAGLPSQSERLVVRPLPSADGIAAVDLVESSKTKDRWGEVMTPAQRIMFRAFAADPSLGDILVIVDDVKVTDGPDPIPLTAYRWNRVDVERYARCGIPSKGIDACTVSFYATPDTLYVRLNAGQNIGR
jgi:hypothetical protein